MKTAKKRMQKASHRFRMREPEYYSMLCKGAHVIAEYIKTHSVSSVTAVIKSNITRNIYATE